MDHATRVRKEHLEVRAENANSAHTRAEWMMDDAYAEYWSTDGRKAWHVANVRRKAAALADANAALDAFWKERDAIMATYAAEDSAERAAEYAAQTAE